MYNESFSVKKKISFFSAYGANIIKFSFVLLHAVSLNRENFIDIEYKSVKQYFSIINNLFVLYEFVLIIIWACTAVSLYLWGFGLAIRRYLEQAIGTTWPLAHPRFFFSRQFHHHRHHHKFLCSFFVNLNFPLSFDFSSIPVQIHFCAFSIVSLKTRIISKVGKNFPENSLSLPRYLCEILLPAHFFPILTFEKFSP